MKKLLIGLSALVVLLVSGCAPSLEPKPKVSSHEATPRSSLNIKSASRFVIVDQSEPAFIVFRGVPKNFDAKKLKKISLEVSKREKMSMLTWEKFLLSVNKYARSVIIRNDYPNTKIVDGLVCLVASKNGSGAPWGLTWNSGIALTFNDYQHARRTYKLYKTNPASYKPIRDPRRDPINPRGHLPFGGCN